MINSQEGYDANLNAQGQYENEAGAENDSMLFDTKQSLGEEWMVIRSSIFSVLQSLSRLSSDKRELLQEDIVFRIKRGLGQHGYDIVSKHVPGQDCCHICGGGTVLIRGRVPQEPKRSVCPTCTTERLEQIQQIADPNYGRTYKNNL